MAHDATFTRDLGGWEAIAENHCIRLGCGLIETRSGLGYRGVGEVEIFGGTVPTGVAYLRAPTTGTGGTYSLHANIAPVSTVTDPRHQVFAGLSGPPKAPSVHWAIQAEPLLPSTAWALFFVDARDDAVQVSPALQDGWHTVAARVEGVDGHVTIMTGGGPPSQSMPNWGRAATSASAT